MSIPGHIRVYYVPSQARRLAKNEAKKSAKQPPTINLDSQKREEGAAGGVKKKEPSPLLALLVFHGRSRKDRIRFERREVETQIRRKKCLRRALFREF